MQSQTQTITATQAKQDAASIFLAKVFNWMAVGLGITGVVAYVDCKNRTGCPDH